MTPRARPRERHAGSALLPLASPVRGQSILREEGGTRRAKQWEAEGAFPAGTVFPVALVAVLTLGVALLIYGRATNHEDLGAPRLNSATAPGDHWHAAYGIYICGEYLPNMSVGVDPDPGGIHTHQDGVIHIHPFQTATTGSNARMGDFFHQTGLNVTATKIELPIDPALGASSGKTYKNGDTCPDGKKGVVKAFVWTDASGTAAPKVFVADIDRIHFTNDGEAFAFVFAPADVDPASFAKPPSAARLAELGAADSGSAAPTSTVPGATTVPGAATASSSTAPAAAGASTAPTTATTAPAAAASAPPTTGG